MAERSHALERGARREAARARAHAAVSARDFAGAAVWYAEAAVAADGRAARSAELSNAAYALRENGDASAAVDAARESVAADPSSERARARLSQVLAQVAGEAPARRRQGTDAFADGRFADAAEHFAAAADAFEAAGGDDEALGACASNLSACRLKLGDAAAALHAAERAVRARPAAPKARYRAGEACVALRRYEDAVAHYAKALELDPSDEHLRKRAKEARERARGGVVLKQLLPGRDICVAPSNPVEQQIFQSAAQMANFIYLVGCASTRDAMVVDPCWDVEGILRAARDADLNVVGAIATHYHFDHVGGLPPPPFDRMGITVPGAREVAAKGLPVHVHELDAPMLRKNNGVPDSLLQTHKDGDVVRVGSVDVRLKHTPGHTPGSMCLHVGDDVPGGAFVLTGDTIFPGSCGRMDLPDSDPNKMFDSLCSCAACFADNVKLFPGHAYGGAHTTVGAEKRSGMLRPMKRSQWLSMCGAV